MMECCERVGVSLSLIKTALYGNCFSSIFILFVMFSIVYVLPIAFGKYDISFFGLDPISTKLSSALVNNSYIKFLLVTLFMSFPPTLQILLDTRKVFSKCRKDRIEFYGSWILMLSLIIPNAIFYGMLNVENEYISDRSRYIWVALTRIQLAGIVLGLIAQLFCQELKYMDKFAILPFVLEKRILTFCFPFFFSSVFSVVAMINPVQFVSLAVIGGGLSVVTTISIVYVLSRILIHLCLQVIREGRFRSHYHLSDFLYSFGLLSFILINIVFDVVALSSEVSVQTFVRYNICTLFAEIFILVLITIIPSVANRRLAEIKHEQLETRLNLIRYVSHEMRTPLNTLSLGVGIMRGLIVQARGETIDSLRGELNSLYDGINKRREGAGLVRHKPEVAAANESQGETSLRSLRTNISKENKSCSINQNIFNDMREIANQITESCDVAVSTLDDLLTFDKLDEQKLVIEVEEINPWKLLLDTAKPFSINASLKEIKFQVTLLEPNADFLKTECIQADPFKLAQVIRNLLSNAIKFTPEKGTVNVTMKIEESGEGGRRVRFSVKDDGAGISAENMKKLFGQYVQFNAAQLQKGKGSGLGLWITKSIVELHEGRIGANSNGEGHGTEFFVDIPLRPVAKTRKSSFSLRAFSRSASVVPRTSRLQTTRKFVSSETLPANNRFKSEVVSSFFTVGLSLLQYLFYCFRKKNKIHHTTSDNLESGGSILTEDFGSFLNYPVRLHNSVKLGFSSNIGLLNKGTDCHSNINGPAADNDIESARIDSKAREEQEPYNPQKSKRDFDFRIKPQNDSENEIYGKTSTSLNNVLPREKWREGLKILLVDDALANRRICKRILTTEGHSVKDAVDGIDCLRVYEEAISLGNSFDLILLDDNMPNLLGYETAKRLRDQGYKGIIIGVTGDIYEENIQRFIENGANDVMPKPLNMEKLEEKFNLLT